MFITITSIDMYKYNLHLGSSKLTLSHNFSIHLLEGFRNDLSIYKIDKLFLNAIFNKNLIIKLSKNYVNFTFLTTRKEFIETLGENAFSCFENYKLWTQGMFSCFHNQNLFEDELIPINNFYKFNFWFTFRTDFVIMFNNTVSECKLPFLELRKKHIPVMSFIDTDSIILNYFFPVYSNDDSLVSINFYSAFFSHIIKNCKLPKNIFKNFLNRWEDAELKKDELYDNEVKRLEFLKSILSDADFLKEKVKFNNKKLSNFFNTQE